MPPVGADGHLISSAVESAIRRVMDLHRILQMSSSNGSFLFAARAMNRNGVYVRHDQCVVGTARIDGQALRVRATSECVGHEPAALIQ